MSDDIALIDFEIRIALAAERPALFRMLELYQHDLSDVWDQDIDEHGEYGYSLDQYWSDSTQRPYVILVESKYAGLALVTGAVKAPGATIGSNSTSSSRSTAGKVLVAQPLRVCSIRCQASGR
jgi:hypothetical protein